MSEILWTMSLNEFKHLRKQNYYVTTLKINQNMEFVIFSFFRHLKKRFQIDKKTMWLLKEIK